MQEAIYINVYIHDETILITGHKQFSTPIIGNFVYYLLLFYGKYLSNTYLHNLDKAQLFLYI